MDWPTIINELDITGLATKSISGLTGVYLGFRFGLKRAIEDGNRELIYKMIDIDNPNLSPLEIARAKTIFDIARIAETYRKSSDSPNIAFSIEWFDRFFEAASLVSDEDMKMIWAKILNGEYQKQGTYSFRFIESMKLLSPQEAELFAKLSKLVITEPDGNLYIYAPSESQLKIYEAFGINDYNLLLMEECGLINMGVTQSHDIELDTETCNGFYNGDLFVRFYSETLSNEMVFKFESYPLTRFGQQVYHLIEDRSCREFVIKLAKNIQESLEDDLVVEANPILGVKNGEVIVDTDINFLKQ